MVLNRVVVKRLLQIIFMGVAHIMVLIMMPRLLPGFNYTSLLALVTMIIGLALAQSGFWWLFVNFFSRLPILLYPLMTTFLNPFFIFLLGRFLPGIVIQDIPTALWILVELTVVNTLVSSLIFLDEDQWFDRHVIGGMVKRAGEQVGTVVPGFLFVEIDGLSEELLRRTIENGDMPTLQKWLQHGSHKILGWETDFSSQTGSMQSGILLGENANIPAYRWWDRQQRRLVQSGLPSDALQIEKQRTNGAGLCNKGGSSRGNMFSGDASESLFTISTLLDRSRDRGPGFYFYLINPYVVISLITRFFLEVVKEWGQSFWQRVQRYPYRIRSRNFFYAFLRGFMSPVLQDLSTYAAISDIMRGLPAIYLLYAGYDDLAHYAGMYSSEANQALKETDRYFARIERALKDAPRPYHFIVLSDHGQSLGLTFQAAYGLKLDELVKGLIKDDPKVVAALDTHEAWDNLNAFLHETIAPSSRTADLVRRALANKTEKENVQVGPKRKLDKKIAATAEDGKILVLASGCCGLIYFTAANERLTQEQIQEDYPGLLFNLIAHPGIGFALVQSRRYGAMVLGKAGVYYLVDDKIEGIDPLKDYGANAAMHIRQVSSYENCPDILLNATYDPITQEISAFEDLVSHHGGLGGMQNFPFILYPTTLQAPKTPLVGACSVYLLLRDWRNQVQSPQD
jgi:hypothetical protein